MMIQEGYSLRQKFSITQYNSNNEESFVCDGKHYSEYDKAMKCFKNSKGTAFMFANIYIDGVKTTIFYGRGNSFSWDLSWRSDSKNNNQWTLNHVYKKIVTKGDTGKPIIPPKEVPKDDIHKLDKYNISIAKLRKIYTEQTNKYRRRHGVSNLTVNKIIETRAQLWAEKLVSERVCKNKYNLCHEGDNTYGENIAMSTYQFPEYIVQTWYNEIKYFDFNNPKLTPSTYHFSQLLWKSTKEFGCGISRTKKYQYFVVCKYYPPGNVNGMVKSNIKPLKREHINTF
uniref:SCP domain-containing protein n=1 Tax=Strongyloides papillosus TaxID=174720 RepID=A0A0N5CCB4_STREA